MTYVLQRKRGNTVEYSYSDGYGITYNYAQATKFKSREVALKYQKAHWYFLAGWNIVKRN
jgi:hypothetical protein